MSCPQNEYPGFEGETQGVCGIMYCPIHVHGVGTMESITCFGLQGVSLHDSG
jgi:hypothetical protein